MANNILDLLQGQLTDGMIDQLSSQLGGADRNQTAAAASGALSTLLGAMAKNASTPEGANALSKALDDDHDGSILDDAMGFLGGEVQPQNSRMMNGGGILKHVLGNRQGGAIDMISKMSGLDSGRSGNLMSMLAPIVMGTLGRQKRQQGLDVGGLVSMITGAASSQRKQKNPAMGMIASFLDQDGDGSVVDDVAGIGMKIFGGLFKRR